MTRTLAIRFRAPASELPERLGRVYGALSTYLSELDEAPSGPPYTRYFSMDPSEFDVEVGMPISKALRGIRGKGEIVLSELPEGSAATAIHVGPYADIESTFERLMTWLSQQGWAVASAPYELYLNGPDTVPESQLQTRIVIPVRPR